MNVFAGGVLCVWALFAPWCAGAESAGSLVKTGNGLYAAGEYDKALEAYEKALSEQPGAGEILFNQGNALFRKGELDKAREAYQAAVLHTKDPALEASAHYNLGNAVFEEGRKLLENDPQKALSQWGESVRHFQDALRIEPHFREAAQNVEMVRMSMKDLADRLKKAAEAAAEQQKQREELQGKLEEIVREQESEVAQNEALQRQAGQESGESVDGPARKLASEQDATREKTAEIAEELKDAMADQPGQPSPQQADELKQSLQDHLTKAQEAQQSASDKLTKSELEEARKDQEEAAKRLREALEVAKSPGSAGSDQSKPKADKQGREEASGETAQKQAAPGDESRDGKDNREGTARQQGAGEEDSRAEGKQQGEETDDQKRGALFSESPESILREEKDNRLQLHRAQQGGVKPVEKDW